MDEPSSFQNVPGTRFFVAGTDFNLHRDESVLDLLDGGIKKVFVLYPITPKQFEASKTLSTHFKNVGEYHRKMGINEAFLAKLYENGIQVSSIIKVPKAFRGYESVAKEVEKTKGGVLFQCINGRHASSAYVTYCLARHSTMPFIEIKELITSLNPRSTDWLRIQEMLREAGVDVEKVVAKREQLIKLNHERQLRSIKARKEAIKALHNAHKEKKNNIKPHTRGH